MKANNNESKYAQGLTALNAVEVSSVEVDITNTATTDSPTTNSSTTTAEDNAAAKAAAEAAAAALAEKIRFFSTINTYGELRDALPPTGKRRVPGYQQLANMVSVVLTATVDSGVIEVYDNGFFTFTEGNYVTVYGVDRCERPETFDTRIKAGSGTPLDFSTLDWKTALEWAGGARIMHNATRREDYLRDESLDAEGAIDNIEFSVKPEYEQREEDEALAEWKEMRRKRMVLALKAPTKRQREIAMMYFKLKLTQEEIALRIGKSQQYVSKTINRFLEIVHQDI